jgi:hypothetical protein
MILKIGPVVETAVAVEPLKRRLRAVARLQLSGATYECTVDRRA